MSDQEKSVDELENEARERAAGQTPSNSSAGESADAEMSVADMEKAVREKYLTEQQEAAPAEDSKATAADVAKMKKRPKNKMLFGIGFMAIGVVIIGTFAFNYWEKNRSPKTDSKQSSDAQRNDGVAARRTDLGKGSDPFAASAPVAASSTPGDDGQQQAASGDAAPLPPQKPTFSRYMALETVDGAANAENSGKTRKEEQAIEDAQANATTVPAATSSGTPGAPGTLEEGGSSPANQPKVRRISLNPDLYISENTNIPCSLDYRFISDLAGKIRCTISKDIYSASGNVKLIPKGTEAKGVYRTGTLNHGQGRAFIMVTKLRTREKPYLDIPMMDTQAAGELGEAGVSGWIDSHWLDRFGGALMLGMIPDVTGAITDQAGSKDRNTDYTENSRQSLAEVAKTAFENSVNIPPTLYKNQGEIINLITGEDIDFSNVYAVKQKGWGY